MHARDGVKYNIIFGMGAERRRIASAPGNAQRISSNVQSVSIISAQALRVVGVASENRRMTRRKFRGLHGGENRRYCVMAVASSAALSLT